jgi:putative hydrolase of the HAD superfamily
MIRHILFDLDNTLYSANLGLEEFFFSKVWEFISLWLKLSPEDAKNAWKEGYDRHGTTIGWLVAEKGFSDTDDFYAFVHPENELDSMIPDPKLRTFLESLPCPCSILTNSPLFHAERVLKKLELEGFFRKIFDIKGNGFKGKPHASAYQHALDELGAKPEETLFIDDTPRYVQGYNALGGKGLLIDERDVHREYPFERIRSLEEILRFIK